VHMRLCRYLRGGSCEPHPRHIHLEGIVTNRMKTEAENDTTFRLRHFLLLVSGSQMLPASDTQRIKVCPLLYHIILMLTVLSHQIMFCHKHSDHQIVDPVSIHVLSRLVAIDSSFTGRAHRHPIERAHMRFPSSCPYQYCNIAHHQ
jgi:hypothetical protein